MTATREPAAEVRLTVTPKVFGTWRQVTPGQGVPDGFDLPADRALISPLPVSVAAGFAVLAQAARVVTVELRAAGLRLLAHGGLLGADGCVITRVGYVDQARDLDWVQVVLLPAAAVPGELVGWVPDQTSGDQTSGDQMPDGAPDGGGDPRLWVWLTHWSDTAAHQEPIVEWAGSAGRWRDVTGPADHQALQTVIAGAFDPEGALS